MEVFFLISVFRLYPGLKLTFEHNSVRKNFFLNACFCWISGLSLREMDQKIKFGGLIGYGNSHLDSFSLLQSVQTTRNTASCCWSCASTKWQRTWLLLPNWSRTKFMSAWSRDWTTLLPLRKTNSPLIFNPVDF